MRKRNRINLFILLWLAQMLTSCEAFIGENGVVIDMNTGERILDVMVSLEASSIDGGVKDSTDTDGYFEVSELVGCVFGGCNEYEVIFTKSGYITKKIDELYRRSSSTKFVGDTLVVELEKH